MSRTGKSNRNRELVSGGQGRRGQGEMHMGTELLLGSCKCPESLGQRCELHDYILVVATEA